MRYDVVKCVDGTWTVVEDEDTIVSSGLTRGEAVSMSRLLRRGWAFNGRTPAFFANTIELEVA